MTADSRRSGLARRAFLSLLAVPAIRSETGDVFPSEAQRYPDPATELVVTRLTDPSHTSRLPSHWQRVITRHNESLLYWSDRTGTPQAFLMDLRNGTSRQLTNATELDGESLTLLPDERGFCYFDGPALHYSRLTNPHDREVYRMAEGFERCPGFSISDDGMHALFAERQGSVSRLRVVPIFKGQSLTVTEANAVISDPVARPRRDQILFRQQDGGLWLVNKDGRQKRQLRIEPAELGPWMWAPGGKTILYLRFPEERRELNVIREHIPDENADKLVSKTSQFVHFGSNGDSSVFVGASRNLSSPYILLLLRLTRRELSLCEHRASDPAMVAPIFSPNSQTVFFQSDRDGKPAIYRIRVERFVEETDAET